jgi:hypothetical protein
MPQEVTLKKYKCFDGKICDTRKVTVHTLCSHLSAKGESVVV